MQDTTKSFMVLTPFIWKPCAIINSPLPNMNKYCSNFTQNKPRRNLLKKQGIFSLSRCPTIYRKNRIVPDSNHLKKPQENPQFTDLINYSTTMKGIRNEFVWRFLQSYPFVTLLGNWNFYKRNANWWILNLNFCESTPWSIPNSKPCKLPL